jgi:hypothetical protein
MELFYFYIYGVFTDQYISILYFCCDNTYLNHAKALYPIR